jgi:hypothetical protein
MASDYLPDDLNILWKELGKDTPRIPVDQLRKEAGKLKRGLRRRSFLGGGAAWLVIASFTLFFFVFHNLLQRAGCVLTVLGCAYILVQLRLRPAREMPEAGETECIRFYRAELERQRDFHRGTWFWSRLLIFLPGPLIFCVGFALAYPQIAIFIWLELAAILIFAALAIPANLRLARKYQRRIDALDASLSQHS